VVAVAGLGPPPLPAEPGPTGLPKAGVGEPRQPMRRLVERRGPSPDASSETAVSVRRVELGGFASIRHRQCWPGFLA
jgi:hypothetical protein